MSNSLEHRLNMRNDRPKIPRELWILKS